MKILKNLVEEIKVQVLVKVNSVDEITNELVKSVAVTIISDLYMYRIVEDGEKCLKKAYQIPDDESVSKELDSIIIEFENDVFQQYEVTLTGYFYNGSVIECYDLHVKQIS